MDYCRKHISNDKQTYEYEYSYHNNSLRSLVLDFVQTLFKRIF